MVFYAKNEGCSCPFKNNDLKKSSGWVSPVTPTKLLKIESSSSQVLIILTTALDQESLKCHNLLTSYIG